MKKALKISLSILLLALAIGVTQIPVDQVDADEPTVSKDADFQMNGTTLIKYTGTAEAVSVPAGVTVIGEEAFAGNTTMETLEFKGNVVETIAYGAFDGCTALKEVTLPDSLQEIGNGAFEDCSALEKITFGKELYQLGIGPFSGCTSLEEIVVPEENLYFSVADGCLYNYDKTKLYLLFLGKAPETYTMPSSVEDIAPYAFWGCDTLKGIGLSGALEEIPDYSFANCKSLTGITIPYSVSEIGIKAFADCVNLETVVIPASVVTIHDTAFDGCAKLNIVAEEGSRAAKYYLDWKERNQAEYEDILGDYVDVSDGDAKEPGDEGNVLGSTHVVANTAVVFIDNSDLQVQGDTSYAEDLENQELSKGTDIPKYTLVNDSILADQAFYKSQNVANYKINDDITEIGEFSFARSNLSYIEIPDGVKTIGYGAFYHCDYLRDVDIPRSVTYIAPKAFAQSQWLNSWMAGSGGEDFLIVGDGILLAYRGDDSTVVIPDEVERIAPEAFAGNNMIVAVTLPSSLVDIGEDSFANCINLKTVSGGENVKFIRDRAFFGCPIETAHIGENVETIGLNSFDFSDTALSVSQKVVVFENREKIPTASYELTAERLSSEQTREMLLGDTQFVIVDKRIKADELEGTILSTDAYGFKGIVAYIVSKDQGIVECIATTYTEEEFADAYIPEYISIDGKSYKVTGEENITVFGDEKSYSTGSILMENHMSDVLENASAVLEGNTGAYTLKMSESEDAYDELQTAYEAVYRERLPEGVLCAEISMYDQVSGVEISRFGKQKLTITVTLPENIASGSVRILTTDRNGQLENIAYKKDGRTFTFSVNHLSPFAFVRMGGSSDYNVYAQGAVQGENAMLTAIGNKLDDSPDTGDFWHPKWFFAAGLASLSLAILFIKKRR